MFLTYNTLYHILSCQEFLKALAFVFKISAEIVHGTASFLSMQKQSKFPPWPTVAMILSPLFHKPLFHSFISPTTSHFHLQVSWNNLISAIHPDYQVSDMF